MKSVRSPSVWTYDCCPCVTSLTIPRSEPRSESDGSRQISTTKMCLVRASLLLTGLLSENARPNGVRLRHCCLDLPIKTKSTIGFPARFARESGNACGP